MTQFYIYAAGLLALALLFIVVPLWRSTGKSNAVARRAANLEIFRDQLAELDGDLTNGLLTPELYEQGKQELQARLLDEVEAQPEGGILQRHPHRILAAALVVVVPVAALGLYSVVGNPNAFLPQVEQGGSIGQGGTVHTEAALRELEAKVAKEPNNAEALLMLARSYNELTMYPEAVKAYDRLTQMVPNEGGLWADYADALAMTNNESLLGKPSELLDKALALSPDNAKALALAGSAAMERGDYPAAVRHWENLLKQVPPGSEEAGMIQGGIQQAKDFQAQLKGGKPAMRQAAPQPPAQPVAGSGKERISGVVDISPELRAKVSPNDTVFIFARAVRGSNMPLAALRKRVSELPFQFALDDMAAVAPMAKLSDFPEAIVMARVSKSGNPAMQPGDMQGESAAVKTGSSGVKVTINQEVK